MTPRDDQSVGKYPPNSKISLSQFKKSQGLGHLNKYDKSNSVTRVPASASASAPTNASDPAANSGPDPIKPDEHPEYKRTSSESIPKQPRRLQEAFKDHGYPVQK
jgi:hypothetical protein